MTASSGDREPDDRRPAGSVRPRYLSSVAGLTSSNWAKKSLPLSSTTIEGGEVVDLNLPDGLHPELGILQHVDLPDAVVGEPGRGPADGAEVEAAVPLARGRHLRRPVALGEHHHAPAVRLEEVDVRVHSARGGGTERTRRPALRPLGRPGVVDHVVAHVRRQLLAGVQPLLQLRVGDVPRHDHRPRQRQPRRHRVLRQFGQDLPHRPVEVDVDDVPRQLLAGHVGQVLRRVILELLQEDAVARDPCERLPVRRAGNAEADRTRGAVTQQPDDADVVREVLAAELRADSDPPRELEDLRLHVMVAERAAVLVAARREPIQVLGGRQLQRLHRELGRGAPHDEREVVGRTSRGPDGLELRLDEAQQRRRVEQRLRLLVEERLVGRSAPLGDEEQLVLVAGLGVDLDLRGQVRAGVLLRVPCRAGPSASSGGSAGRRRRRCPARAARGRRRRSGRARPCDP